MSRAERLTLDLTATPATINLARVTAAPAALPGNVDADISPATLDRLLSGADPGEVFRPWLVYAGAAPATPADRAMFHAKPETWDREGLFHATARLWGRRTSIRYADPARTPFRVGGGDTTALTCGTRTWSGDTLEPEASCLRNLSYWSDGRPRDVDPSITINPIQSCAMRCRFCRRQYDHLDDRLRDQPLMSLAPAAAAEHLIRKYPGVQWGSRVNIAVVTGTFADFDHLCRWVGGFVDAMGAETGGAWRPARTPGQNVHVLTHLVRTREQMRTVRDIGVKTVQDTAEIIDPARRVAVMPKANPRNTRLVGKAEVPWEAHVAAVSDGVEVFGPDCWYTTVILGLDDATTTARGLADLSAAGLRWLDRPVYQAFSADGLGLYAMGAADLIGANVRAGRLFRTVSTTWDPSLVG